jgi:sporulation protein YlmC with PRC-barrel domain
MNTRRWLAISTVVALWLNSPLAWAQNARGPKTGVAESDFPKNDKGEPEIGLIRPLTRLVGAAIHAEGLPANSHVADVALDLGRARVVSLIVTDEKVSGNNAKSGQRLIPWSAVRIAPDGAATAVSSQAHADRSQSAEKNQPQSTLWSQIRGTPILSKDGTPIGELRDMAIAINSGVIAYTALATNDTADELRPAPLSALVVHPQQKAWLLELPADVVRETKAFSAKSWPNTIDRGWLEYVHVRYGGSALDGVRTETAQEGRQERR